MIEVEVNNTSAHAIDESRITDAIRAVLQGEGTQSAQVSVAVVDDETIQRLNREYLEHDYPTDVLSFVFDRSEHELSGEVILSADTAARVATEFAWPAENELLLYAVHGTLHLVGYDDHSEHERTEMRGKESDYLAQFGIQPRYEMT